MVMFALEQLQDSLVLGCDTETYSQPDYGLKSIQVWGQSSELRKYITTTDWLQESSDIRSEIASKFLDFLKTLGRDTIVAFFNLRFDFSQFSYYFTQLSGLEVLDDARDYRKKNNFISVLESPQKCYKVMIKFDNHTVTFIDIGNFLTATTLDNACKEWVGKSKLEMVSKRFDKAPSTPREMAYAMRDAQLTYELFTALSQNDVVHETDYVTIAGRTMAHFKEFIKSQYGLSFNKWAYDSADKDEVVSISDQWEDLLRPSLRGGYCASIHDGYYANCKHIDATSLYPSQMVKPMIPYGGPLLEKPDGPFTTIVYPIASLSIKPGKIPYLQFRSDAQSLEYLADVPTGEKVTQCVLDGSYAFWHDEWELICQLYDVKLTSVKEIYIRMKENNVLASYIRMLFDGKKNNTGTKRYYFKILMNSLYGKFLTSPKGESISYSGGYHKIENDKHTYYLPIGSWIAMSGRVALFNVLNSLDSGDVLYCDTDSCIYKGDKEPDCVIGDELGQWKVENTDFDAWIVGPKCYQELNHDGTLMTKCAGLPDYAKANVTFKGITVGSSFTILKAKRDAEDYSIHLEEVPYLVDTRPSVFNRRMIS